MSSWERSESRIESVSVWRLAIPLPRPVHFGSFVATERGYVVVRMRDTDGAEGVSYCLERGAPILQSVKGLAPHYVGRRPAESTAAWDEAYAASITHGQRGVSMRALSLLDIAMHDLRARRLGVPVHELLGAARTAVPVMVGGGYFREAREWNEITEELATYVATGLCRVKVPGGGESPAYEESWLDCVRDAVGPDTELAVDAHWSWRTIRDAIATMARWERHNLLFVEDPLWPEALSAAAELRQQTKTPIAIGDEQSGRWAYQNMLSLRSADVWRVDLTTVGGFTEAQRICAIADAYGIAVSTHVYLEMHLQLALAQPIVWTVEWTSPDAGIDMSYQFVASDTSINQGLATSGSTPGLGISMDWDFIEANATLTDTAGL